MNFNFNITHIFIKENLDPRQIKIGKTSNEQEGYKDVPNSILVKVALACDIYDTK